MPLDINLFREEKGGDLSSVRKSHAARGKPEAEIEDIIKLDTEWRALEFQVNQLNKEVNAVKKSIGEKYKKKEDAAELLAQKAEVEEKIKQTQQARDDKEKERNQKLINIGNLVHESVPVAVDEKDNVVVKVWGSEQRDLSKKGFHHHELLHRIDGYASEPGVEIAGHRAYFLKGPGVLLNQALINYGISFLLNREYTLLQPPFFMRKEVMAETAQLTEFDEALYKVTGGPDDPELYLIATSEQPISAFHRHEWLEPDQLPIKYGGLSTCFRKEAGSHGRDAWGIFRIHQFEKVEQFVVCKPEESWKFHEEMIKTCEEFYQSLGLPYQVINIVSGALNNAAAKKYDLEAWFPKLGVYRELVSASNCTDYQSRAMETRLGQKKMGDKFKNYVHMLNATLVATERTICCILENYQDETGVKVPEVLQPFMGGRKHIPFVKEAPKPSAHAAAAAAKEQKEAQ